MPWPFDRPSDRSPKLQQPKVGGPGPVAGFELSRALYLFEPAIPPLTFEYRAGNSASHARRSTAPSARRLPGTRVRSISCRTINFGDFNTLL